MFTPVRSDVRLLTGMAAAPPWGWVLRIVPMRPAAVTLTILIAAPQVGCGPPWLTDIRTSPDFRPSLESHLDKIGRNQTTDTRLPPMRDWAAPAAVPRRDPWRVAAVSPNDALVMGLGTTLISLSAAGPDAWATAPSAALSLGVGAVAGGLFDVGFLTARDIPLLFPRTGASMFGIRP